jgi:Metal-dependent amidase/aminoacylase/carboxypeptidase
VIGTPSEEGICEYAGSNERLIRHRTFKDIDFVIGMHPDSEWNVGCQSPTDITANITFRGKASHLEEPDKGVNALDALVMTYLSIRNLVASMQKYKHVTAGMYIKKEGTSL